MNKYVICSGKKKCNVELKSYICLSENTPPPPPPGWGLSWQLVAVLRFAELLQIHARV